MLHAKPSAVSERAKRRQRRRDGDARVRQPLPRGRSGRRGVRRGCGGCVRAPARRCGGPDPLRARGARSPESGTTTCATWSSPPRVCIKLPIARVAARRSTARLGRSYLGAMRAATNWRVAPNSSAPRALLFLPSSDEPSVAMLALLVPDRLVTTRAVCTRPRVTSTERPRPQACSVPIAKGATAAFAPATGAAAGVSARMGQPVIIRGARLAAASYITPFPAGR